MIIGDSFSDQGNLGYYNFLAEKGLSVLLIDRHISGKNPIQILIKMINSDYFNNIQVNHIVLQSVERDFIWRCQAADFGQSTTIDSIKKQNKNYKNISSENKLDYFSYATVKAPLSNIQYLFYNKPIFSQTYKIESNTDQLFSNTPNDLLFYQEDIQTLNEKNDPLKISTCNFTLNKINDLLFKRNIQLIVLVSPDKYDLYYSYIKDKSNFEEPLFFTFFEKLTKRYLSVPSYSILSKELLRHKDVYYYDDTHWAPKGASIIANEIYNVIANFTQKALK